MKRSFIALFLACSAFASTNVLVLHWDQPPGWRSTLYYSTNLNGDWSVLSTNGPDAPVVATQSVAFFYVQVSPPVRNGVYGYTNDPNVENVRPDDTNQPAFSISVLSGGGTLYWWNVTDQTWE